MKSFVTHDDISTLKKNGINYDEDIVIFINEMKGYLYKVWRKEWHTQIDNMTENTIEEFNKLIGDYPSKNGYDILSSAFDVGTDDDIDLLSEPTLEILNYFYNISI